MLTKWFAILVEHELTEPRVEMNSDDASLTEPCTRHICEDTTGLGLAIVRQAPTLRVTTKEAAEVVAVRVHVNVCRPNTNHLHLHACVYDIYLPSVL